MGCLQHGLDLNVVGLELAQDGVTDVFGLPPLASLVRISCAFNAGFGALPETPRLLAQGVDCFVVRPGGTDFVADLLTFLIGLCNESVSGPGDGLFLFRFPRGKTVVKLAQSLYPLPYLVGELLLLF